MPRKHQIENDTGSTILLVDDKADYLEATRLVLADEGHRVLVADSGAAALACLKTEAIDLLLLDYYMPGMTGEEVVSELRRFNPYVQVILQTGYASEQPPRALLRRLDIQGYYDKSEGPEKLLLWVDVGLKAAYTMQLLFKSRQGLKYILNVTPDLHRIQPLEDLLQGILWQVAGLLGATNAFLAVLPDAVVRSPAADADGFVAMIEDNTELIIRASTGHFEKEMKAYDYLGPEQIVRLHQALRTGDTDTGGSITIVPLYVGAVTLGVIYLDRSVTVEQDIELIRIFANQAAVAIQNSQLYVMATLDQLTGVFVRRFFEQQLMRECRVAFRAQQPLSLLMLDIDNMKAINDEGGGHRTGDLALAALGRVLRQATRGGDIVGRYGGDEFVILLPQSGKEGATHVAQRIVNQLAAAWASGHNPRIQITASVGVSVLEPHTFEAAAVPRPVPASYFQTTADALLRQADVALYQAKHAGRNQLNLSAPLAWAPFTAGQVAARIASASGPIEVILN